MPPQYYNYDSVATEIDQLLPVDKRKTHSVNNLSRNVRRRPLTVANIAVMMIVALIYIFRSEFKPQSIFHNHDRTYIPSKQVLVLNDLTTSRINSEKKDKFYATQSKKKESMTINVKTINVCTCQLMIMRHCEKDKEVKIDGVVQTKDTTDIFGNRHCSTEGKARSDYIATLFESAARAVRNTDIAIDAPMMNTSEEESSTKPRFPPPLKLYALSQARFKGDTEQHKNFREIETLRP